METLVILAVVVWILFKLVQKVTSKLYPQDSVKVQEKPDTTPATDAWGNYPKAEGHVVLFEQFRREQAQRQQAAKEAETFYRSREWRRLRYQAFQRYGNKCCVCGRGANDGMVMHVDHIKPRSLYPHLALDIANLQIMCNECNVSKGNRDEVAWQ